MDKGFTQSDIRVFAERTIIVLYFSLRLSRDCLLQSLNNFNFQEAKGPCNQTKKNREKLGKTFPKMPLHPLLEPGEETPRDWLQASCTLYVLSCTREINFSWLCLSSCTAQMKAQHGSKHLSSHLGMNSGANCNLDSRNYKFSVSHIYKLIGQQTSLLPAIIKIKHLFSLSVQSGSGQQHPGAAGGDPTLLVWEHLGQKCWRRARHPLLLGSIHQSAETAQGIFQTRAGFGAPQPHVSWSHPTALGGKWSTEASSSSRAGQAWPEIEHSWFP